MNTKNVIAQQFRKVKEKYGITTEDWSKKSKVPMGTISRYLSASPGWPNFLYTCALLECLGEPFEPFYRAICAKIEAPEDALKFGAIPAVIGDVPIDVPSAKAEIQERIIVQTEEVQQQRAIVREKDMQIEMLELKLEMFERLLEEKERTVEKLEDINHRRLEALKALCIAQ